MVAKKIVALLWWDGHLDSLNPEGGDVWADERVDGIGVRLPAFGDDSLPRAVDRANDYDGSGTDVDVFIAGGDNINASVIGAVRNANFAELTDRIDGTVGAALTSAGGKLYPLLGHHDLGGGAPYGADDYAAFFHNDGMGSVIPALGAGAGQIDNQWWPTVVADDTPCAYTVSKNGFRLIFLCAVMADIGLGSAGQTDAFGGDAESKTQLQWLEQMLDEAQAANEPVIIFVHQPILSNDPSGPSSTLNIGGWADAITLFAEGNGGVAYTISIIVVSGHAHRDQSIITSAGVVFINVGGDVWGKSLTDTTRFTHAVLEVTAPTHNTIDGNMGLITLTGYGYQRSWSMDKILVGHWKLDEPDGKAAAGNAILDSSGNAFHGTNSETVVSVLSPIGFGVSLDGAGDYISDTTQIITDYPFSMRIWAKQASLQTAIIFSMSDPDSGGAFGDRYVELELISGVPNLSTKQNPTAFEDPVAPSALSLDIWHHIVGVWTSATVRELYVDGILVDNTTTPSAAYSADIDGWTIGARTSISAEREFFTGDLSDGRIYSGALSASDISQLFREGARKRMRGRHDIISPGMGTRRFRH